MYREPQLVERWRNEYRAKGIPSSFRGDPSGSVITFANFLAQQRVQPGKILDLGCGSGRNSVFMAEQGFEVFSVDFVPELIGKLREETENLGLAQQIHPYCHSVTQEWPFDSETFVAAFDTFCYKHQVDSAARRVYRGELQRVLKPSGFYLITCAGIDDGYYGPLLSVSPKPDERMIVDPVVDIPSILFSKEDMLAEFNPAFRSVAYEHKLRDGMMHGQVYKRSTHVFVLQK